MSTELQTGTKITGLTPEPLPEAGIPLLDKRVSRRGFLRTGALAGLGLWATACGLMKERELPGTTPSPKPGTGGGSEPYSPIDTATPTPQHHTTEVPTTSTPDSTPELTPAKRAIQEGRIELHGKQDIEKYFIEVSPEEARKLRAQAEAQGKSPFILPFLPLEKIIIENYTYINQQGMEFTYLGVKNAENTTFYSQTDGKAFAGQTGNIVNGKIVPTQANIKISDAEMQMIVYAAPDIPLSPPFSQQQVSKETEISIGNKLFNTTVSGITRNGQNYNFVLYIARSPNIEQLSGNMLKSDDPEDLKKLDFSGAKLENLLMKDGKIVIVAPKPTG